jgi:hypothetical protein
MQWRYPELGSLNFRLHHSRLAESQQFLAIRLFAGYID